MKNMKKLLSLLLAGCMLLSLCATAFAYKEDEGFDYVALGASMTNGYGMRYYLDPYYYNYPNELSMEGPGASGYRNNVPGSYPSLVAAELANRGYNVNLHQLAQSSMRVEELRYLLDDSFSGDEYTRWRFFDPVDDSGFWGNGNLDAIRQDYRESVRNAELISFDMGVNNFGVYISNQIQSGLFGTDFANIVGEEYASRFYALREQVHAAAAGLLGDASALDTVDSILDIFAYALLGFEVNFDATMKCIRELNPDCDIVTLSIQNPMAGMDATLKGFIIPFGEIYGIMTEIANAYMVTLSPYAKEYYFADVRQNGRVTFFFDELMQYNGDPHTLSQSMLDCFNVYDRKLHANQIVKKAMQDAGIPVEVGVYNNLPYNGEQAELYNDVLYKVYDALAKILITAGNTGMPLDGLIAGDDLGKAGDELMDGRVGMPAVLRQYADSLVAEGLNAPAAMSVEAAVFAAAPVTSAESSMEELIIEEEPVIEKAVEEQIDVPALESAGEVADICLMANEEVVTFEEINAQAENVAETASYDLNAAIDALLCSDVRKLAAAFGMRTSIGNTFFTHPNDQGHQELASAVLHAWDREISSRQALAEAVKGLESKALSLSVKYGPRVLVLIAEKFVEVLTPDEGTAAAIKDIIPSGKDLSDTLAKVLELLNVKDFNDFGRINKLTIAMGSLDRYLENHPEALHAHIPVYVMKADATCTKDGHTGYWYCTVCNKKFADFECTKELKYTDVAIPAHGHDLKKVEAKAATVLSTGNIEYYICRNCGLWYYDEAGTKLITNPLSVVTPKLSIFKALQK